MSPLLVQACCQETSKGFMQPWGRLFFRIYHTNLLTRLGPCQASHPGPEHPMAQGCWVATTQGGSGWAWEANPCMEESKGDQTLGCPRRHPCPGSPPAPILHLSPSSDCASLEGEPPVHTGVCSPWITPLIWEQSSWTAGEGRDGHSRHSREGDQGTQYTSREQAACGRDASASPASSSGAMASSYRWCQLVHVVDLVGELVRRGLSEESAAAFLDSSPALRFFVHFASRRDCPSECLAKVWLAAADSTYTPSSGEAVDESANSPSTSAGILHSWSTGCVHPGLGRWQRAECVMAGYPQGVRRAVVVLQGRDRRYWAGHYGAKFALPCLHFWAPDDGSGLASGGRA